MTKKKQTPGKQRPGGGRRGGAGPSKHTRGRTDTEICPACDHSWSFHGTDGCSVIVGGKPCGCYGEED